MFFCQPKVQSYVKKKYPAVECVCVCVHTHIYVLTYMSKHPAGYALGGRILSIYERKTCGFCGYPYKM